jgi:preprotein translocase subunit SecA
MDYLRGTVNLRAYGQRDPLVEYKREGLGLFKEMENSVEEEILRLLPHLNGPIAPAQQVQLKEIREGAEFLTSDSGITSGADGGVGRNDPCPCGSGKKYKKCGMLNTEEHQKLMAGRK